MFSKTAFALITATVLAAPYTSVQARTHPGGGVTQATTQPRGTFAQGRVGGILPGDPPALVNRPPRHCVSSTMEEGARSAFPAWDVCSSEQ
jgi:hypothetical protein